MVLEILKVVLLPAAILLLCYFVRRLGKEVTEPRKPYDLTINALRDDEL